MRGGALAAGEGGELVADHASGIEDQHHGLAVRVLDHAGQQIGRHGAADGGGGFDPVRVHAGDIGHAVDDQADRTTLVEHHHAGCVVVQGGGEAEHFAQVDDRQHGTAQVGQPFHRRRADRHPDDIRHTDDFLHLLQLHREFFVLNMEHNELAGIPAGGSRIAPSGRPGAPGSTPRPRWRAA